MKPTKKGPKTASKSTSAEAPKHRQAAEKLQRFSKRQNRLIEKWGKYGNPVVEALRTAQDAFDGAVKFLLALPDDFLPPVRMEEKAKKKSEKATPAKQAKKASKKIGRA